jgi:hypothetical protein
MSRHHTDAAIAGDSHRPHNIAKQSDHPRKESAATKQSAEEA